uniref:Uncharacterized protein n=1 Tax=Tanacetum cinerariifolium TaxID=118510 RepID=A0A6L2JUI0_TANCI|nr:hypothetical protein [Tanacetum cinerariifolium]
MLDWNNPEGDRYPFDLSKPLPLQGHLGHLTVAANYFFNDDLEYLKSFDLERTYTTSITKTKATRYKIEGTKDMVPTLWSPTKVGVKSVSVKKLHGYGYFEEIVVKRADLPKPPPPFSEPPKENSPIAPLNQVSPSPHSPPSLDPYVVVALQATYKTILIPPPPPPSPTRERIMDEIN